MVTAPFIHFMITVLPFSTLYCGHCCPIHCVLFKIYCAPPNLDTRIWICRLNFAQWPIFSGLRFFNEPEISDSGAPLKVPPGVLVLRIFMSWKKSFNLSWIWTPESWNSRRASYPEALKYICWHCYVYWCIDTDIDIYISNFNFPSIRLPHIVYLNRDPLCAVYTCSIVSNWWTITIIIF